MRTYKLYGSITATTANLCSVLLAKGGRIKSARWAMTINCVTDNSGIDCELSTASAPQIANNDTLNEIDEIRSFVNFTTSGYGLCAINHQTLLDYPVAAGERLYIHALLTSSAVGAVTCFVDVDEGR